MYANPKFKPRSGQIAYFHGVKDQTLNIREYWCLSTVGPVSQIITGDIQPTAYPYICADASHGRYRSTLADGIGLYNP